jgi:hypothetical protein
MESLIDIARVDKRILARAKAEVSISHGASKAEILEAIKRYKVACECSEGGDPGRRRHWVLLAEQRKKFLKEMIE